jgi:Predicted Zn-dependent peptidases, insulinase-like
MSFIKSNLYEQIEDKHIDDINSRGVILRHKKSGARIFLLSNDDINKVFMIGFRTPPKDDTGLTHILEHSVLCGSDKFPAKDPFVELVKGSLNTFLNAMTYPDKTVYPVASCNSKDFANLMDVYMDAVLNPNIYKEPKIFKQEGWHYELEDKDSDIIYNGVVFNEMKGAFSDPDGVLDRYTRHLLFPDTAYGYESGGDPKAITNLTYNELLDFHKKYYHPSNSYIYLYGDMDMEEKLEWLDKEYLSKYDSIKIDTNIDMQVPFGELREHEINYAITDEESEDMAAYLSFSTVVGENTDKILYAAFQILEYALLSPASPLKKALIDAGIGDDIIGGYENGILQPYFTITAKNTNKARKADFLKIIKETLLDMVEKGIDKKSILAGINFFEFRYREADYGGYPKGLMYGLQSFDSWLYDENKPMLHLEYQDVFDYLKIAVNEGYFEKLIKEKLIEDNHSLLLALVPKKGLTSEEEKEEFEQLKAFKETLSVEEINEIIAETSALKQYQSEPSSKEDLEKIPMLKREDIDKKPIKPVFEEKVIEGTKHLYHNIFTSGIGYIRLLFSLDSVETRELPYLSLLKTVLGYVDTKNYTYGELFNEINIRTGGIRSEITTFGLCNKESDFLAYFEFNTKLLYNEQTFGISMIEEIIKTSKLSNEKRLLEIILELKSKAQTRIMSSGHSMATLRAASYNSESSYFDELTGGIEYYKFLDDLSLNFDDKKAELIETLNELMRKVFTVSNLFVDYTGDIEGYNKFLPILETFKAKLSKEKVEAVVRKYQLNQKNEGFKISSAVNYVARTGSFKDKNFEYTGTLKILKVILGYDYLWQNIRVKGGAYGCMSGFGRSGEAYFVSYRDPNINKTNEIFEGIPAYIEAFDVDERDMTKYVIGTISDMDIPLNPKGLAALSLSAYMSGITYEMLLKERDEVLKAGVEDIRKLSKITKAVLESQNICVVGNVSAIENEKELFMEVKNLF